MPESWYVVTRIDLDTEPTKSVQRAHGPLEAALAACTRSLGEELNPYSVEVDRQSRAGTLVSIRVIHAESDTRRRFEVTQLESGVEDPLGAD